MAAIPKTRLLRWLIPAGILALLAASYPVWFGLLGAFLVHDQPPFRADLIVVLAGDESGHRILKAAELVREGWAPHALVSGPFCCYGVHESEPAIAFAVRRGCPAEWFIPLPLEADSTREEAQWVRDELARRKVGRFLVVTSNYHTRRARSVYRKLYPEDRFHVVAAPDPFFAPHSWWHTRQGRKQFAIEWLKTVGGWLGM